MPDDQSAAHVHPPGAERCAAEQTGDQRASGGLEGGPATAQIYNGLIRNIEVTSKADVAYDTALEHPASCGFGYFRIDTRCDEFRCAVYCSSLCLKVANPSRSPIKLEDPQYGLHFRRYLPVNSLRSVPVFE